MFHVRVGRLLYPPNREQKALLDNNDDNEFFCFCFVFVIYKNESRCLLRRTCLPLLTQLRIVAAHSLLLSRNKTVRMFTNNTDNNKDSGV